MSLSGTDTDLNYLSATELLARFRQGLSPVKVLQAHIDRWAKANESVNAFTFTHFDQAMVAAKESEQRYKDGNHRALEGIPIALKDEHGRKREYKEGQYDFPAWTITSGCKVLKDHVVTKDHPVTAKLLEAGAVLHAQTTAPEMYVLGVTWSLLWGVTRSPWNGFFAAGGSSGGAGAALAAGMTTLAVGSDMGGSIRIPAAFNGLYGFKPPFGRVAGDPDSTMPQASDGPMARTFDDLVLMQNVLSGDSPKLPTEYDPIAGSKIAYSMDQGWAEVAPDIRRNTKAALEVLEKNLNTRVDEVQLGLTYEEIYRGLLNALLSGPFGEQLQALEVLAAATETELTTYARAIIEAARRIGPKQAEEAVQIADKFNAALQDKVFGRDYKALVMPTLVSNHIYADLDPTKDKVSINGKSVPANLGWALTPLFNVCYRYPVIAVPTGLDSWGRPTSMQIAGPPNNDVAAFQVAAAYSAAVPPLFKRNRFPSLLSDECGP